VKSILRAVSSATLALGLWACGGSSSTTEKCLGSSTKCGDSCVSLHDDVLNCGACGNPCAEGQTCSAGTCAATCAAGYDTCGGTSCVDLQVDPANCGACGTVCDGTQVCRAGSCTGFTVLASGVSAGGLPDFVPVGATTIYASGAEVDAYDIAGDAWSKVADGGSLPNTYAYPAWVSDSLYVLDGGYVDSYSITGGTYASVAIDGMPSTSNAQTTGDGAGNLYALATDGTIVQYNITGGTFTTFTGPDDLPAYGGEPRAAWDTKTAKVYLADYESTPFYSFDPATGTLTPLAPFPTDLGMNDAFCSDRNGHIYTADAAGYAIYMYDTAVDAWTTVGFPPFPYLDTEGPTNLDWEGTCTVTADGYLYIANGWSDVAFKMKL
jgi:hypothetical protein